MPMKKIQLNKYKHKKTEWITNGILKSIKFKDNLYKRMKLSVIGTVEHTVLKHNLSVYNSILKRLIPKAKNSYYYSVDNYRPISLLPAIYKVFEKVVYHELYSYFLQHNLLCKNQYGFRKQHSTEHAILEGVDRIGSAMDNGNIPIAIFLDLSKAFDTLDHKILLSKLQYYGIKDINLQWFESYLLDRSQYVQIDDIKSDSVKKPLESLRDPF